LKRVLTAICFAALLAIASHQAAGIVHAASSAPSRQSANAAAPTAAGIVATAKAHLGNRYADIGNSPATGFSCIGFVNYVFAQNGVVVPFSIPAAWNSAPHVSINQLLPGDVLFFSNTVFAGLSHVAIYIGGGEMIGADNFTVGVTTDRLADSYWMAHYTGATRPLALSGTVPTPAANQSTAVVTPTSGNAGQIASPTATPPVANNDQAITTTATATLVPRAAATAPGGTLLRLLAPVVGLYSGPGYQYISVANAYSGSLLTVLVGQGDWYSVRQGDTYGWVIASKVAPIDANAAQATPATSQVTPAATPTQALSQASLVGSAPGSASLYVIDGPLLVRSGPGKTFQSIGSLTVGTPLQVRSTHPHWALVTAPGNVTGWVSRQYLGQAPPARSSRPAVAGAAASQVPTQVSTTASVRVNTAVLNVRAEPDSRSPVIATLFAGETVHILARRAGWDQVMLLRGTVGWVDSQWLADPVAYRDRDARPPDPGH
jgi:uncharacterized protein YgiM (DUF1202 family)